MPRRDRHVCSIVLDSQWFPLILPEDSGDQRVLADRRPGPSDQMTRALGQVQPLLGKPKQSAFVGAGRRPVRQIDRLGCVIQILFSFTHGASSPPFASPPLRVTATIVEAFPVNLQNRRCVAHRRLIKVNEKRPAEIGRDRLSERELRFAVAWNFPLAAHLVLLAIAPIAGRASLQFQRADRCVHGHGTGASVLPPQPRL